MARGRTEEADQIVVRFPGSEGRPNRLTNRASVREAFAASNELRTQIAPLRSSGKLAEAIELVEDHIANAEEGSSSAAGMQLLLADLYVENSRDQDAIALWKQLADEFKTSPAIVKLAQHYRSKGLVEKLEEIEQAASQPNTSSEENNLERIRFELAGAYRDRGLYTDELRVLREVSETRLNPWMKRYLCARVYEVTGDAQKALDELAGLRFPLPFVNDVEALLLAIDVSADDRRVRLNQALSLAKQASLRPASGRRSAEYKNDPLRSPYRSHLDGRWWFSGKNTLGIVHYRRGEYDEALKALEEFRDMKFEEPSNWLFLAMTHWQLGDREEARKWYSKATEFLDQKDYEPTRMEKLFRKEAEELLGEDAK